MVWELRHYLPESLAIEYILEPLVRKYKNVEIITKGDKDANLQFAIMLLFSRICSRAQVSDATNLPSWCGALPLPHHADDETWREWTDPLRESQERILKSDLPYKEQLLLPVPIDAPLDNMCYASFVRNQIDPSLPTETQHILRSRLWDIGEVLRILSNVLGKSAELAPLQNLIRKCFVRIRYILDETFQRNWQNS
jgi:hypothetical protein